MRAITNHYAGGVITTKLHMMAVEVVVGVGGGRVKSMALWGWRPAGQSCAFTREIREGGV